MRALYDHQREPCERLKVVVDNRLLGAKQERWHYESRLKTPISFAQKLETGRCPKPNAIEDFFACTVVVKNTTEIATAEALIRATFDVVQRRPRDDAFTAKPSYAFPFDDLRLYARLKTDATQRPTDLGDIVFEIQVKTFLQHAWSVATHDLVYKTDEVSWGKERIAYQIKAMLEHAELSIKEAETLAKCNSLPQHDKTAQTLTQIIPLLREQWSPDELPPDLRRLAETFRDLMDFFSIASSELKPMLEKGRAARSGQHPANLSPMSTFLQYILEQQPAAAAAALARVQERRRIFIPAEVTLPPDVDPNTFRNAIFPPRVPA